jgi:hypothetical protein
MPETAPWGKTTWPPVGARAHPIDAVDDGAGLDRTRCGFVIVVVLKWLDKPQRILKTLPFPDAGDQYRSTHFFSCGSSPDRL